MALRIMEIKDDEISKFKFLLIKKGDFNAENY